MQAVFGARTTYKASFCSNNPRQTAFHSERAGWLNQGNRARIRAHPIDPTLQ